MDFVRENTGEPVPEGTFHHLLDFLEQNEEHRQKHQESGWTATPSRLLSAPTSATATIFTQDALPYTTLPIYPGLEQPPNMLACIPGGLLFILSQIKVYGNSFCNLHKSNHNCF